MLGIFVLSVQPAASKAQPDAVRPADASSRLNTTNSSGYEFAATGIVNTGMLLLLDATADVSVNILITESNVPLVI